MAVEVSLSITRSLEIYNLSRVGPGMDYVTRNETGKFTWGTWM